MLHTLWTICAHDLGGKGIYVSISLVVVIYPSKEVALELSQQTHQSPSLLLPISCSGVGEL